MSWPLRLALAAGYAFLYVPIALLIVLSFNGGRSVAVWGGWSTRWYGELLANDRLLDAAWLSLVCAAASATLAAVLGTVGGFAMGRLGRFPLRLVAAALLAAPLVMPEVVTGLSLLLLFVEMERWLGWPAERGLVTIVLAHATFTMAFVAVIVQARLASLDPALEDAAADLGASPARAFLGVTLPGLAPAIAAGWLLAFTLSLDDAVIAGFVSGPGATTLPLFVFASVRLGLSPQINALAAILVGAVALCAVAAWILMHRNLRRGA